MFMIKRGRVTAAVVMAAALMAGAAIRLRAADEQPAAARSAAGSGATRFFEMRTYYAAPGKMDDLNARFRNHTNKLFQKHGIDLVGYWQPVDDKNEKKPVLVYILAYPSREAREKSWKDFNADPDWQAAKKKSEENGTLVSKVDSVYMTPTDYSPIK
jgi:hypothetical protein